MTHHVLVVDDDPGIREVITQALEGDGYSVATAGNGREALDRVAESRPLLVLLDLQMPIMTGWEVLSALRESKTDVPVVFMTAGYRAQAEAEKYHADGFMAKPFDLDVLFDVVERLTPTASERP